MPASETQDRGRSGRPHTVIFWTGVGLAPLAALLVLFSSGTGALRVAALLAVLAVTLVGLSIMMRPDPASVRAELEGALFDEIDGLRADVRADITTAARATHKSFSEKLQSLYENVEAMRGQLDSARGRIDEVRTAMETGAQKAVAASRVRPAEPEAPAPSRSVGTAMVGGGVVRHTETVQVTTRQTIVDQGGDGNRGRVYGASPVYGHRAEDRISTEPRSGRSHRDDGPERAERAAPREESWTEQRLRDRLRDTGSHLFGDPGRFAASGSASPSSATAPGAASYGSGSSSAGFGSGSPGYGSGSAGSGHGWRGEDGQRERGEDGRRERGEDGRRDADEYGYTGRRARSHGRDDADRDDPSGDPRWSDMRAGDRWASVRRDEHGREVRMGERRAALHSDESGTELRIEDRWAAVRREDAARSQRGETRRERREREERWTDGGREERWTDGEREERWTGAGRSWTDPEPEDRWDADPDERWSGGSGRSRHSVPPAISARHSAPPAMGARHSAPPAISARHSAPPAMSARHSAPPALTATPSEYAPAWPRDWREEPRDWREETNGGRRERERVRDELPRPVSGSGRRRVGFEATDDRWR